MIGVSIKAFQVVMKGEGFDSFECAIHALAPTCKHPKLLPFGQVSLPKNVDPSRLATRRLT